VRKKQRQRAQSSKTCCPLRSKEEVLALHHQVTDLRHREQTALGLITG
jgi:hypothetical protein